MNGKIKAALIVALVLGLVASAIYVAPTLAYLNGDADQTRDRDMDKMRDRDCASNCVCDCDQIQTQTRTRLHLQECVQNQTSIGPINWQHQYEYQYRHQNMLSP